MNKFLFFAILLVFVLYVNAECGVAPKADYDYTKPNNSPPRTPTGEMKARLPQDATAQPMLRKVLERAAPGARKVL
jgi:hypothetical protein